MRQCADFPATYLLGVPAGKDDRAERLPPLLEQDAKSAYDLMH